MLRIITAIEPLNNFPRDFPRIFLGGGITGCAEWQAELIHLLETEDAIILNPRRANFPIHDPNASVGQIVWEYRAFREASLVSFWFAKETVQPIVMYELGAWALNYFVHGGKEIALGCHPDYPRRQDVEIQLQLLHEHHDRPITVYYKLTELADQIRKHIQTWWKCEPQTLFHEAGYR